MKITDEHYDPHEEHKGRIISRREALKLFAFSPFILGLAGCSNSEAQELIEEEPLVGSCVARPQLTEGPFYIDTDLLRSDIREDRQGALLTLDFHIQQINENSCTSLADAIVDIWHADAGGDYSGVENLLDERFLRGIQRTNEDGNASFTTVYPGWYRGRSPHIHFKVRSSEDDPAYEFTSQLFFKTELSEEVYQLEPYSSRGIMDTSNANDSIYRSGGTDMILDVVESGQAYTAAFNIGLHLT